MKNPVYETIKDSYLLKNVEAMSKEIKCPLCGEADRICIHEYRGAYDGWLYLECLKCNRQTHRISQKAIIAQWQPEEWGPVYFKTGREYYKNLSKITKKEYERDSGGA